MADLKKTIEIIFGGKNEVSKTIGVIEKDLKKMGEPIVDAAKAVAKLDAALVSLAAGGIYYAFKKSVEYENSVVSLRKVVGDSPKEMEAAQDAAMKFSNVYGESATKILEATSNFVQAGFTVKESIQLTKDAMDLKIAGDISAAQSSEYLISMLKGFKAPAEEAGRIVNILNEVSNKYATNTEQLAIAMSDLSPIAKIMGFSLEETAGLVTPVIEVFRSGSESAMALKTGLLKLIDDSKPVGEALAELGVRQKDANGQLRSGKDILLDVSKAFKTLDEPQKLFITQQLTGIDQAARMVEVFNGLDKSLEVTAVAMKSAGSAQAEVDQRLASSEVTINRLGVGFENLARIIGEKFKKSITDAAAGGFELENALRGIVGAGTFDPLLDRVNKFSVEMGKSLRDAAKNMPEAFAMVDWSSLLKSIDDIAGAMGDLFGVDTSNPKEMAKALQMVVASMSSLMDVTKGMGEVFAPIIKTAVGVVEGFNTLDASTKTLVGNLLGAAVAYKLFGPVVGTVMFLLGQDAETMKTVVNTSFAAIENGVNAIKVAVLSLAMIFSTASQSMAEMMGYIPFYDASEGIKRTGDRVKIIGDLLNEANSKLVLSSDKVAAAFFGTGEKATTAQSKVAEYSKKLGAIPEKVETALTVDSKDSDQKIANVKTSLASVPETRSIVVEVDSEAYSKKMAELDKYLNFRTYEPYKVGVQWDRDGNTIEQFDGWIKKTFESGKVVMIPIEANPTVPDSGIKDIQEKVKSIQWGPDGSTIEKMSQIVGIVKQTLANGKVIFTDFGATSGALSAFGDASGQAAVKGTKEALKKEKELKAEVKAELKMEDSKLKEQSAIIQKSIEWKAKVDISSIESAAKTMEATFKSVDTVVNTTSTTISDIIKGLSGYGLDNSTRSKLESMLRAETEARAKSIEQSQTLAAQQIEMNKLRLEALKKGDATIKVSADGLKPHLEMILWEVLEAIQMRANQSQSEFLLGMK